MQCSMGVLVCMSIVSHSKWALLDRWGPREGKAGEMSTPGLLPIALATLRTSFLGSLAVWCGLGLPRENRDSRIGGD